MNIINSYIKFVRKFKYILALPYSISITLSLINPELGQSLISDFEVIILSGLIGIGLSGFLFEIKEVREQLLKPRDNNE